MVSAEQRSSPVAEGQSASGTSVHTKQIVLVAVVIPVGKAPFLSAAY